MIEVREIEGSYNQTATLNSTTYYKNKLRDRHYKELHRIVKKTETGHSRQE